MHKAVTRLGVCWFIALLLSSPYSNARSVLKIRASGCKLDPVNRGQAGFVVNRFDGIVTALHGVADCSEITAESFEPRVTLNVVVDKQDPRADAALLVPRDHAEKAKLARPLPAFEALEIGAPLGAGVQVVAYGFEGNVLTPQRNTALKLGVPPTERLGDILGSKNTQEIAARGSPSINLSVIKLEGTVNKGDSGGPVVVASRAGTVIGLVLGAPDPGNSNLAWVAPINEIAWEPFSRSQWERVQVPKALADAVRNDEAPVASLRLQLRHGPQVSRSAKEFPVQFEFRDVGAGAHTVSFWPEYGARFERADVVDEENVGVTGLRVDISHDGRKATLSAQMHGAQVVYRGVVKFSVVREIPARKLDAQVEFSATSNGVPFGERTIEAASEGLWEEFTLADSSERQIAVGKVGSEDDGRVPEKGVYVNMDGSKVTIGFQVSGIPEPPPTIIIN